MSECRYLHAYYADDWGKCPPNSGPVRKYQWIDETGEVVGESYYCDDGAEQAASDPQDSFTTALVTGGPVGERKLKLVLAE